MAPVYVEVGWLWPLGAVAFYGVLMLALHIAEEVTYAASRLAHWARRIAARWSARRREQARERAAARHRRALRALCRKGL